MPLWCTILLSVLAGCIVGFFIGIRIYAGKSVGYLQIDNSKENRDPYLFLECDKNPREFMNKRRIVLRVILRNFPDSER